MSEVEPMSVDALVELVNGWGSMPREVGGRGPGFPSRSRFAALAGRAAKLTDASLVELADNLYAVFAAGPSERVKLVSRILAESEVRPGLRRDQDVIRPTWRVPQRSSALSAGAALVLRDRLSDQRNRLGLCAAEDCADVYVDASPAAHRRFCSLTCQNRTRVASFRQRKRAAT